MKNNAYLTVVGGGASGLAAACRAALRYPKKKIVILEKADRVGKKILVSGNGRCNLSNTNASAARYHGEDSSALVNILFEKYDSRCVLDFFSSLGLMTRTDSEGRVYPLSNLAGSVLDVLRLELDRRGVEILTAANVERIKKTSSGFELCTAFDRFFSEKVVVSCGGFFDYACRGGMKNPAVSLGLKTSPLSPALSPVRVDSPVIKSLKGVRAVAEVTLFDGEKKIRSERGEVQFTENALSGICVFNLSRYANHHSGCEISVALLPDYSKKEIYFLLKSRVNLAKSACIPTIFTGMFHKNIALALLKSSGVSPSARAEDISDEELKHLSATLSDWRFKTTPKSDFKNAQVTAGGVLLSEIDPHTFSSKRFPGLFIIGEALDVDGDCGGYNLQFAFSSGLCAGDYV